MTDTKDIRLTLSSSPHLLNTRTTTAIMLDVCIALIPALIASVLFYGWRALLLTVISVAACVVTEYLTRRFLKRSRTIDDLSAVVTGILIAFNVPASLPIWMLVLADVFAILVVKEFFGGLGQNFMNPALAARILLATSFAGAMGLIPQIGNGLLPASTVEPYLSGGAIDATATATPLMTLKSFAQTGAGALSEQLPPLSRVFLGFRAGVLGEISALALIIGGIYLLIRKVISPLIPLTFIGTVAVIMLIAGGFNAEFMAYQLLTGGLMLGAIFMATDYATSPLTASGKVIFGIGCGIITCLIRLFGSLPEGVSFAIVLMNLLVPHIEKWTRPRVFGETKHKEAKVAS